MTGTVDRNAEKHPRCNEIIPDQCKLPCQFVGFLLAVSGAYFLHSGFENETVGRFNTEEAKVLGTYSLFSGILGMGYPVLEAGCDTPAGPNNRCHLIMYGVGVAMLGVLSWIPASHEIIPQNIANDIVAGTMSTGCMLIFFGALPYLKQACSGAQDYRTSFFQSNKQDSSISLCDGEISEGIFFGDEAAWVGDTSGYESTYDADMVAEPLGGKGVSYT